jgi:hypothetical protein
VVGGPSHRAAHPGLGQVGTLRWHLQPGRLRLRPIAQHLHLPEWQAAAHHRNSHRRQYASLSCLKARLRWLPIQMRCCPHTPARQIPHDLHEDPRDVARALAKTEAFEQSRRERKKVEMRFAHMKRIFKLDRLRLRGLSGAKDEVLLTATAQNLRAPRQAPLPPATNWHRSPVRHSRSGIWADALVDAQPGTARSHGVRGEGPLGIE